jgi:DNA-binding NarL/FixJ family response regulator
MNLKKPKIFIIDNSKPFRTIVIEYLTIADIGSIVGEASDALFFLGIFKNLNIDILVMDIHMPNINGILTLKTIKQYSDDIKIIALSQYEEIEYQNSVMEAGASAYITKSEVGNHLIKGINAVMQGDIYFPIV